MRGSIRFSENINMESVLKMMYESGSVGYCFDERVYGKYTVDIDAECMTYHIDEVHALLKNLNTHFDIKYGFIEMEDGEKTWAFEYDTNNKKWAVRVVRKVYSMQWLSKKDKHCCTRCDWITSNKTNYCPNCGAFSKLTDRENNLINREVVD